MWEKIKGNIQETNTPITIKDALLEVFKALDAMVDSEKYSTIQRLNSKNMVGASGWIAMLSTLVNVEVLPYLADLPLKKVQAVIDAAKEEMRKMGHSSKDDEIKESVKALIAKIEEAISPEYN